MTLTKWDDYYIHQNFSTLDKLHSENENAYERICLVVVSPDGKFHLGIALGTYPNKKITDVGIGIRCENTQRSIYVSKPFDPENDRDNFMLGPFHARIVEPAKLWKFDLAENDYGISFSLKMEGRSVLWEGPINWGQTDERATKQGKEDIYINCHQTVRISGTVTFEGKDYSANGWIGGRDRTWGVRPLGKPGGIPGVEGPLAVLGFENWGFAHFREHSLFLSGMILNPTVLGKEHEHWFSALFIDDGTMTPLNDIRHRVEWLQPFDKYREYTKEEWLLKDPAGKERRLAIRPIGRPFFLDEIGYDGRQGKDFGGFHIEGVKNDVSKPLVILEDKRWGMQRACEFELDGEKGLGFIESFISQSPKWKYIPTW